MHRRTLLLLLLLRVALDGVACCVAVVSVVGQASQNVAKL
jgi:hypothetical protein